MATQEDTAFGKNEYEVASVDDFEEGSRIITEVNGQEIAVFHENGEYHALANYCPHQSGPLCEGPVTGKITAEGSADWKLDEDEKLVTCPWHYWKFDISTGRSTKDNHYKVPIYDVSVRDGKIIVEA